MILAPNVWVTAPSFLLIKVTAVTDEPYTKAANTVLLTKEMEISSNSAESQSIAAEAPTIRPGFSNGNELVRVEVIVTDDLSR